MRRSSLSRMGPDQHVVAVQPVGELGEGGAAIEMIGTDGEHHRGVGLVRDVEQAGDELVLLAALGAGGECLLELIDEHDPRPTRRTACLVERAGQLPGGVWAGAEDGRAPRLGPGEYAGGQRRQQPGPDQR